MKRRPRLLVFNQYYWPGLEATAHLLSDLCGALADEFDVTVVTGRILVHAPKAGRFRHEFVTLEHLLFALLEDSAAREILFNCGADLAELSRATLEAIGKAGQGPGRASMGDVNSVS